MNAWTQFLEIEIPYNGNGYSYTASQPYEPSAPMIWAEYDSDNPLFNCAFSGGGQKLENGHIFTTSAAKFTLLEHDANGNIVWFFDLTDLHPDGGQVFKAQKYPKDYTGFSNLYTSVNEEMRNTDLFHVFYNPVLRAIKVEHSFDSRISISYTLSDMSGRILSNSNEKHYSNGEPILLDAGNYPFGMYILNIVYDKNIVSKKVIVTN